MLYNAAGHTIDGPVLAIDLPPGRRVVNLLPGRDADLRPADNGPGGVAAAAGRGVSPGSDVSTDAGRRPPAQRKIIHLYLPRDDVACLAILLED